MKPWFMIPAYLAVALITVSFAACGDPCKDLSQQICNCELTSTNRAACLQRVSLLVGQYTPNPNSAIEQAGRQRCAELLSTCTCTALQAGQLDQCGLSKESGLH